jgi:phage I-like protein
MLQAPLLNIEIAAAQGAGATGAPEAPSTITIWPGRGEVQPQDGRGPWKLDAAESVIADSLKAGSGNVLPVDIDHGVHVPGFGRTSRAVGWISALKVDAASGAVSADVEWTEEGRQLVTSRAYRFISPTFFSDKAGRVRRFLGAALVNCPAIPELPKVASAVDPVTGATSPLSDQENAMTEEELVKLRKGLGLDENADGAAIVTAAEKISAAHAGLVTAAAKVAKAVGQDELTLEAATGIAAKLKTTGADPDPAKYVPIETFEELKVEVASLRQASTDGQATQEVEAAIKAGKVIPAQKDWALNYARRDIAGFQDYLEKTPVILNGGRSGVSTGHLPKGSEGLTDLELQTCRAMGLTVEQYKQAKED